MAMMEHLARFVDAVNSHDLKALEALLARDYFSYSPVHDEPEAQAAFSDIARDLIAAASDFRLSIDDVQAADDGEVTGTMTAHGTFGGTLWGVPGSGSVHDISATVVARPAGDQVAIKWEGTPLIPVLRELGLVPMPEAAHLRPEHPAMPPEIIFRLAFNGGQMQEKECAHLGHIKVTEPTTGVCQSCVDTGTEWPALRMCLECGFVGCCDLSTNKHCKAHYEETGHPIFRSIHAQERWLWCYGENAFLASWHLAV